jgi:hypothetical protein
MGKCSKGELRTSRGHILRTSKLIFACLEHKNKPYHILITKGSSTCPQKEIGCSFGWENISILYSMMYQHKTDAGDCP